MDAARPEYKDHFDEANRFYNGVGMPPTTCTASKPFTLREHLLAELKSTHNVKDWFVPANDAVAGLSAKDASWIDGSGNHSVGMLANHLVFWDRRTLQQLKGEKRPAFSGNNDETFNTFDEAQWADTQKQLDSVLTDIEHYVEKADEKTLEKNAPLLTHIATHNAYHIGQMIYVRKLHGGVEPGERSQIEFTDLHRACR